MAFLVLSVAGLHLSHLLGLFLGGEEEEPLACGYFIILYIDPLGFLLRLKSLVLLSIYDVPLSCGGARQRLIRRIRWGASFIHYKFYYCTGLQTVYASLNEVYASEAGNWHFANALSAYKDKLKPYIQFVTADGTPYKYGTLCLKNRVNLNDETCENMGEIYTVTSANSEKTILDRVTTGVLEPGVAYIVVNNNPEGLTIPNSATFTLDKTAKVDEPVESEFLQGVFEDTYAPKDTYVIQPDEKFHRVAVDNAVRVGAYKAYLKVPGSHTAKALSMQFGGETTGIDGISETQKKADTSLYDLTGRRVTTPQKGQIYIRSGKKVLY